MKKYIFIAVGIILIAVWLSPDVNFFWGSNDALYVRELRKRGQGIGFAETCGYFGLQVQRLNVEIGKAYYCQPI